MVVDRKRQQIEHHHVRDLPELLASGDRLVLNDTQVLAARLLGKREKTGGYWQGLFLTAEPDGSWRILCKTRGRLHPGEAIRLSDRDGRPGGSLILVERLPSGEWRVRHDSDAPPEDVLKRIGRVPLPPYIRGGNMIDADEESYQTVFARRPGAVAAPTAGLHFTPALLQTLVERGIGATAITLHVGLGTFRPIEAEQFDQHRMHSEWGEITPAASEELNGTHAHGGRLVAVGTTVTRLLESAVRTTSESVKSPTGDRRSIPAWSGTTDLFIRPPFDFLAVDALLTNFHFPRTTLLVLVQTLAGQELIAEAYKKAVEEEYRFYSYGDAMLIV
jgi:S-adenosylmethionine:tRNA ribosyltransferase-isomerase